MFKVNNEERSIGEQKELEKKIRDEQISEVKK